MTKVGILLTGLLESIGERRCRWGRCHSNKNINRVPATFGLPYKGNVYCREDGDVKLQGICNSSDGFTGNIPTKDLNTFKNPALFLAYFTTFGPLTCQI